MSNRQFLIVTGAAIVILTGWLLLSKYEGCLVHSAATGCPSVGPLVNKTSGARYLPPGVHYAKSAPPRSPD